MTEVSAGILYRPDGRVLVCQRGEGRKNAHLWEFPGGKREAGESAADCLRRELMEELHLTVHALRTVYTDVAQGIRFTFLMGHTVQQPVLTEHEDARFLPPRALLRLPFCPADTEVARALALNAPPLRHFFWDLDGTLMDTYPLMVQCLMAGCQHLGIALSPARALCLMKQTLHDACVALAQENDLAWQAIGAAFDAAWARCNIGAIRPMHGIPETLAALTRQGGRHYLVTHRGRAESLAMLEACGLRGCFADTVCGDDAFPRKPAPDSCLHLLRKHAIDPATAVMIGDRPLDTAAGRAAGMLSCLLDIEGRFPDDPCELRTDSALHLPDLLCPAALCLRAFDESTLIGHT